MHKSFKIGITNDTQIMRCRLLVKLIEICGATPILIPTTIKKSTTNINQKIKEHLIKVNEILENCDALIFPGNKRDIHPALYNSSYIHPQTQRRLPINPNNLRQETEIAMIKYALKKQNIPILGICGGMQLINAILGGNLVQHLPDDTRIKTQYDNENYHYDSNLKNFSRNDIKDYERNYHLILNGKKENIFRGTHSIKIYENSLLSKIYYKINPQINLQNINELSIHHQGCFLENLSDQLQVAAISNEGVIEAAEHKKYPKMFLLTQFHPECNSSGIALGLVEELINSITKPDQKTRH